MRATEKTFRPDGLVMALDEDGRVVHFLQDPKGRVINGITGVREVQGQLLLGGFTHDYIGVLKLDNPLS